MQGRQLKSYSSRSSSSSKTSSPRSPSSPSVFAASSSSSSSSSEMTFKCTGWICTTSSSASHSGQFRISPSSTSSSSRSISTAHSGQRTTAGPPGQAWLFDASVLYYVGESRGEPPQFMSNREFPEWPLVGVGGVVIDQDRALLVRRARVPALGEWTIPGGLLEVGETLTGAVEREILEETGLTVRVVALIEALERIFSDSEEMQSGPDAACVPPSYQEVTRTLGVRPRPRYHYVILDYLCERVSGEPAISAEVSDLAFVAEKELAGYALTPAATRVLHTAFAMSRARAGA